MFGLGVVYGANLALYYVTLSELHAQHWVHVLVIYELGVVYGASWVLCVPAAKFCNDSLTAHNISGYEAKLDKGSSQTEHECKSSACRPTVWGKSNQLLVLTYNL